MIDTHVHYEFFDKNDSENIHSIKHMMEENGIEKAVLIDIDEDWYFYNRHKREFGSSIIPCFLLNPFDDQAEIKLSELKKQGVRFVKYLPYEQNIYREDYGRALDLAYKIEKEDMVLIVCAAYGSENIYRTNGVELTEYLLRNGIKMPIIVAHGGMPKIIDLFALMCQYDNVYFDLSFSLQYWWDSSVVMDYAYVVKKLNYERVFYGSDYPYVSQNVSLEYFDLFCSQYHIDEKNKAKMLSLNFENLLNKINM